MNLKKLLWAVAILGLVVFAYFAYFVYNAMFVPNTAFEENKICILIPSDADYNFVRGELEPVLKSMSSFDALAKRKQYVNNVKPGKYCLRKGMNNNDIINTIRSKNEPIKLSFNNQPGLALLAGRVAAQIEADSTDLLNVMTDQDFLEKNGFNLDNALSMYLPNSYEFFWNTDAEGFRSRMLKEYKAFWNEERRQKAKDAGLSPLEVMTLASIVHEESKQASEQPRIAGVYMNRLKNNWPLQADPTLRFAAYKLPQYQNTIIKRVLNVHKAIQSPYNTYTNTGLPPGLICMPDISAIKAVLNYEKHDYYYFAVDVQNPGFHKFAKSLAQHNRNAREYHKYLDKKGIRR